MWYKIPSLFKSLGIKYSFKNLAAGFELNIIAITGREGRRKGDNWYWVCWANSWSSKLWNAIDFKWSDVQGTHRKG